MRVRNAMHVYQLKQGHLLHLNRRSTYVSVSLPFPLRFLQGKGPGEGPALSWPPRRGGQSFSRTHDSRTHGCRGIRANKFTQTLARLWRIRLWEYRCTQDYYRMKNVLSPKSVMKFKWNSRVNWRFSADILTSVSAMEINSSFWEHDSVSANGSQLPPEQCLLRNQLGYYGTFLAPSLGS